MRVRCVEEREPWEDMPEVKMPHAPWQLAARRMVAEACREEWRKANVRKSGRARRKHVAYRVPEWCESLLKALETEHEVEAKRIMLCVREGCLSLV